jgi:alpha-galactosidase
MALKIAIIGAGSVGFTRTLVRDILGVPELADTHFSFHDINLRNLEMVQQLVGRDIASAGLAAEIAATLDRREAINDADYVLCFIRQGGLEAFQHDVDIPLRYGVDQCVGDTLGPGGIMYAQRGIPELLDICRDIRELAAPDCLFLNYSNPMAMLTWACAEYGGVDVAGLCHGVQHGHHQIARALGLAKKEVDIICAGINHQTWYIDVRHRGEDLAGRILEAFEAHEEYSQTEKVRIDMLRRFGFYSTESNGHLSEYLPWYRKRPEETPNWIDTSSWINGETGGYLRVCTEGRRWFEQEFPQWMAEPPAPIGPEHRSEEHGSWIIEARETGRIYRGHFNRVNDGVITNLPFDCIIEAPGYVDGSGIQMPVVGDLPSGCAAVCSASVSVQRLSVEAAMTGDIRLLRQAFMMDPLTGAVCTPGEIDQMADEMLVALAPWLPQWADEVPQAEARLAAGPRARVQEGWRGSVRLPVRTAEEMASDREQAERAAGASDKAGMGS